MSIVHFELVGGPRCGDFAPAPALCPIFKIARAAEYVSPLPQPITTTLPEGILVGTYAAETGDDLNKRVMRWQGWSKY